MDIGANAMVQVDFSLKVGSGRLDASANVPAGPATLPTLLPVLQELCSNVVDATAQQAREEGFVVSCKAGCGACCRQVVPISLFEAEALADWVRSLPQDQQAILEARFDAAVAALNQAGIMERLQPSQRPKALMEEHQLGMDYLRAGVPCPFLLNESCGIHPIRPIICREYLVTSPAEFCSAPTPATVRPVPIPMKLSHALMAMASRVTDDNVGWMPLVLLFHWIRSGRTMGDAYEKAGPELFRQVIEQVAVQKNQRATSAASAEQPQEDSQGGTNY